jgi:hypothetical protein
MLAIRILMSATDLPDKKSNSVNNNFHFLAGKKVAHVFVTHDSVALENAIFTPNF